MQLVVVACVTVLFVLITVLAFQIAIRISHNNQYASLQAERARLEHQLRIAENDLDILYNDTDRFIREWAHSMGWTRPGQSIFR